MTHSPTDAFEAFAIRVVADSAPIAMTQSLGTRILDHRGLVDLPALLVLVDDLGGVPFALADRSSSSLQARLTMSMGARPDRGDVLRGDSELEMFDDALGSTTVRVVRDDEVVVRGQARSVRVGRTVIGESGVVVGEPLPAPDEAEPPPTIDPTLSGAAVIASIADGTLRIGPRRATQRNDYRSRPDGASPGGGNVPVDGKLLWHNARRDHFDDRCTGRVAGDSGEHANRSRLPIDRVHYRLLAFTGRRRPARHGDGQSSEDRPATVHRRRPPPGC